MQLHGQDAMTMAIPTDLTQTQRNSEIRSRFAHFTFLRFQSALLGLSFGVVSFPYWNVSAFMLTSFHTQTLRTSYILPIVLVIVLGPAQ